MRLMEMEEGEGGVAGLRNGQRGGLVADAGHIPLLQHSSQDKKSTSISKT